MFDIHNRNIMAKFNEALKIVAEHYSLAVSRSDTSSPVYGYDFIVLGMGAPVSDPITYNLKLDIIKNEYKYLVPFFKVWMAEVRTEYIKHVTEDTFREINKNIEEIKRQQKIQEMDNRRYG